MAKDTLQEAFREMQVKLKAMSDVLLAFSKDEHMLKEVKER